MNDDNKKLKAFKGSNKNKTRKGRGNASGLGGECGRGHKGQKSRSGFSSRTGFEGGQNPLYKRIPKKPGMLRHINTEYIPINLDRIQHNFEENEIVELESLVKLGLIKKSDKRVKVLGKGDLTKKLTIKATSFSKSAIEKIEKSGSTYTIVDR